MTGVITPPIKYGPLSRSPSLILYHSHFHFFAANAMTQHDPSTGETPNTPNSRSSEQVISPSLPSQIGSFLRAVTWPTVGTGQQACPGVLAPREVPLRTSLRRRWPIPLPEVWGRGPHGFSSAVSSMPGRASLVPALEEMRGPSRSSK